MSDQMSNKVYAPCSAGCDQPLHDIVCTIVCRFLFYILMQALVNIPAISELESLRKDIETSDASIQVHELLLHIIIHACTHCT